MLLIYLLTLVLVVVSVLLCLLVLLQLPKKDAGISAAFGAEQTAALFGAGSGTALTSITKWLSGIFLGLCLVIAVLTAHATKSRTEGVARAAKTAAASPAPAVNPTAAQPVSIPTNALPAAPAPATNAVPSGAK